MTAGSIIAGGFGLVRDRPGAVAVWGLIYLAASVALALALRPLMGTIWQAGEASILSPDELSTAVARMFLLELAFIAVAIVLYAAVQRAVLQPEREGFAYLRLGMDELRMFGLALILIILFYFGLVIAILVLALVVGLFAVAAGPQAAVPLIFVAILAMLGLLFWFQVRLSLAFPFTLLRGRIVVGEAWRATRGRFWTLFVAFLAIFLLLLAMWIAVSLVANGGYFADLARSGFTPEGIQRASERQMERQFGALDATTILGWVLTSVAGTLSIVLFGGAAATAARELTIDVEGLADTFA